MDGLFTAKRFALLTLVWIGLACNLASAQPNIVFFVVDDLGAYDTAVAGSRFHLTPHIDELAAQGMSFNHAYASHPRCTPSRYGMMSGQFPARGGVPGKSYALELERTSMAEAMNNAGYATWFVGKWHLTKAGKGKPDEHGFQVNIAGGQAGAPGSYEWPYDKKKTEHHKTEKNIEGLEDGVPGKMLTDHLTEEAERLIREHAATESGQPFFLTLCHYGVHTPFEDTPDRVKMFRQRLKEIGLPDGPEFAERDGTVKLNQDNVTYAAMLYRVDESLGRVRAVLAELGLDQDTVIVFTSDHGGLSNRGFENGRSLATSNAPLRAGKGHLFEGGIRVPLIVAWPGKVAAGSLSDAVTTNTDFFPTFLSLAGAELMPEVHRDGKDISSVIHGDAPDFDRGPIFWHSPRARPNSTGDHNASAIRHGRHKLIHWHDDNRDELFDLIADPSETSDLSTQHPDIAADLRSQLDDWLAAVDAVEPRNRQKKK
ncbi:MAG: sulfatase [Planctomycetota bacterium]